MAIYRFHLAIHARPAGTLPGAAFAANARQYPTLAIDPAQLSVPLAVSFEQAAERLQRLPRLFFEPDGSFVWVSSTDSVAWQVDGSLFDRAERLLYVELKGSCAPAAFDHLLAAFGWPELPLVFQLMRPAVFLDEATFREFAANS